MHFWFKGHLCEITINIPPLFVVVSIVSMILRSNV